MNLLELRKKYGVDEEIVEVLRRKGIEELYPPQADALDKGVLEGENLVLAIPTAAGKTLVAELCMLESILRERGKCLYIVPLRALASEKYEDFKEKYGSIGVSVGIATGDYDVPGSDLAKYDILIATSEKVDSLLRHKAKWLADMTTVVAFDEIHLINDPGRGPTLEVLAARLGQINPELQILGLSATISNSQEIADWLDARHVRSEWRPVPLKEGVYLRGKINFKGRSDKKIEVSAKGEVSKLAVDTIKNHGGQVLVFVSTRRSTQTAARKVSKGIGGLLSKEEKEQLRGIAQKVENALGESTKTCRKLARYVRNGVAFHHAGLHHRQRSAIEDAFRKNLIKVVCATPTLAAGVNLPAQRVIIRDYKRYSPPYGMKPIPVLEYKQMCMPYREEILLPSGTKKKIGEIIEDGDDKVLSYNIQEGEVEPKEVINRHTRKTEEIVEIGTETGSFSLTPDHPVLVWEGDDLDWKEAHELERGDRLEWVSPSSYDSIDNLHSKKNYTKIKSIKTYDSYEKVYNLSVEENENYITASGCVVHNCGRAGRPGYDDHGESVLISSSEAEMQELLDEYVWAEPERIRSKLASEPAIRTHLLGSIAAGYVNSLESMLEFIEETFFAYQYAADEVSNIVEKVLDFLKEEYMVSAGGRWLSATKFGKKVSQLYIDPLSGVTLRDGFDEAKSKDLCELGILHLICATPDMDTLYLRKRDYSDLDVLVSDYVDAGRFLLDPPEQWKYPEKYEFYLAEVKTAKMLQDWINEQSEELIHERYGVGAGDIRRKVSTAEWLSYAAYELAKLFNIENLVGLLRSLRRRVRYGIKEELVELASLRGIGRVRARSLFKAGYRDKEGLGGASLGELANVRTIGKETAKNILKQVEEEL